MRLCVFFLGVFLLLAHPQVAFCQGQAKHDDPLLSDQALWVEKAYIILFSSKDYSAAKKFAENSAKQLNIPLDLRGLSPHPTLGLTDTEQGCQDSGYSAPCYVARELEETRLYISVEYSNSYSKFSPNYYIVLAAVGPPKSMVLREALKQFKPIIPDAYLKTSKVYVGCRH